ncbi:MAG: hypothetical protein PF505_05055 [Vallitaleaceae bacterium]|jgi:hypothetical protein|nr:hypothetical protein [Vallitaleaceae bacterium]
MQTASFGEKLNGWVDATDINTVSVDTGNIDIGVPLNPITIAMYPWKQVASVNNGYPVFGADSSITPNSSGASSSMATTIVPPSNASIMVNGKSIVAGMTTDTMENGKTTTTMTID